jgi:hypothetical protein
VTRNGFLEKSISASQLISCQEIRFKKFLVTRNGFLVTRNPSMLTSLFPVRKVALKNLLSPEMVFWWPEMVFWWPEIHLC